MERDPEDHFRPKLGRSPRERGAPSFLKTVRLLSAQAGDGGRSSRRRRYNGLGRGRGALAHRALTGRWVHLQPGARRVVVKARVIKRAASSPAAAAQHLKYLQRDGVAAGGAAGRLYGADSERVDGAAFLDRTAGDPHQFRFIVAPEDAAELADLNAFTRELMAEVERDLGARLDWVAVDHFNTGHPHSHIVLRGRDRNGEPLFIAGDYIAHGLRERASERLTLELGPESWEEVRRKLLKEIDQDRFTRIDRALLREADAGRIDLQDRPTLKPFDRVLWQGRLKTLERMGLAKPDGTLAWRLKPDLEMTLRTLAERSDIIKTIHHALWSEGLERPNESFTLHGSALQESVVGRLLAYRLSDELSDRTTLIVDGIDGRVHHVPGGQASGEEAPIGALVEVRTSAQARPADLAIATWAKAHGGVYRPSERLQAVEASGRHAGAEAMAHVEAHVRRLEALRRVGAVEREGPDHWRIPDNLEARAVAYEARRGPSLAVRVLASLDLKAQIDAKGVTWLDRQLVGRRPIALSVFGFGAEVAAALEARRDHHLSCGDADPAGEGRVRYRSGLLAELERRDLEAAGARIAAARGLTFRAAKDGETVRGVFAETVALSSGRYALVERSHDFTLVPWRPVIDAQRGQTVLGVMQGQSISWQLGRQRALGL